MMSGGAYHPPEGPGAEGAPGESAPQPRNPLLCFLCDDYYAEPCLLSCYHSFCSRCLRGRDVDGKLTCPLCGQQTTLKEGTSLPPVDMLMRQLIELSNAENPPCANCDKRDKASMYFCSTCGQALCNHCRENTHRAKMFSTHEVVHMSKCSKEGHRRCAVHGEQYIMFSNTQKTMLCVNCFRDTPAEARLHCVDIDTAYTQGCKKLDRAVMSVCDLQNSVREGLLMFKTLLEELRRNMESEKHTINSFCQGMQEAIAKTHANMIMEVQRQFETKERQFRGQLISLGTVLPLLQLHLLLCSTFSSSANKYQFLDLAYPMMDRLAAVSQLSQPPRPVQSSQIRTNYRSEFSHALEPWVGKSVISATQQQQAGGEMGPQVSGTGLYEPPQVQQPHQPAQPQHGGSQTSATQHFHPPPSRRQHSALRAKALEGEGPFSNHCRSFDSQIKELSQQLCGVKERLGELHRDVTLLRRAHTPPLAARYEHVTRECAVLEEQLERHQVELERLKNIFDTLWEEQLCRIHVEQEIFQSQMNDILTLRAEVKHLSLVAHQLEPYVKALTASERNQASSDALQQQQQQQETTSSHQQLQSLLEHISMLQFDAASSYRIDSSGTQKGECRVHPGQVVTSPTAENIMYMKVDGKEAPVREMSRARGTSSREQQQVTGAMLDVSGSGVGIYGSRQQQAPAVNQNLQNVDTGRDGKRGVLSQLIEKVRTKEDRKKSPVQEEARVLVGRERSKSDGRGSSGSAVVEGGRTKLASGQQGDDSRSQGAVGGGKGAAVRTSKGESSAQRYVSAAPSRESSSSKVASLYHTISGKVLGSRDSSDRADAVSALEMSAQGSITSHHHLPPPPPPTTSRRPQSHHEDITSSEVAGCLDVRERLEAHLKEKLHEMMGHRLIRPSSVGEKGIDSQAAEESEYQRISEATTSPVAAPDGTGVTKQAVRAMIHREPSTAASTPTSPHRHRGEHQGKMVRLYPASDTEDSVLYATEDREGTAGKARKQNSCESLTLSTVSVNSRRSSVDLGDRKTLVVVIGTSSKGAKARLMQKQRSWETFPPKKRGTGADEREGFGKFCRDPDAFRGGFELRPAQSGSQGSLRGEVGSLKKADSFEGHEEAVRTLVAAVQETRTQHMQQQRKQSQAKQSGGGN